jgi:histidinol dehydrogenase
MSIPIIRGSDAAQAHIAGLRSGEEAALPERITVRLREVFGRDLSAQEAVEQIITDIRKSGDSAVKDYTKRIDGPELDTLFADADRIKAAYDAMNPEFRDALHASADRIRAFHTREPRQSWLNWEHEDEALGQILRPIQRVGVYAPGGTAAYPSSLLMAVVPAQVAGVEEILVATPPGSQGAGTDSILAAAHVVGLKQVLLVGGTQAIAALAYGTESVPQVDKIFGAGNLFVTLAKKHVYGDVGIDGLYGPTETLLIADDSANPALAAADLLAQAEHDPLATALLLTPSHALAKAVQANLEKQLAGLERRTIIQESLTGQGAIMVIADLDEAVQLANQYAAEHLCLLVQDPWSLVGKVRNAGGVFVGETSSEALGDYVIGPSHVMPTRGTARFASPLHVRDFLKVISVFALSAEKARELAPTAQTIAREEGLTAHAAAAAARGE